MYIYICVCVYVCANPLGILPQEWETLCPVYNAFFKGRGPFFKESPGT